MYTLHARSCKFGADLNAQSVIISKISALELTRKFLKSALLVGKERGGGEKGKEGWSRRKKN